jgi:hypothetical protein
MRVWRVWKALGLFPWALLSGEEWRQAQIARPGNRELSPAPFSQTDNDVRDIYRPRNVPDTFSLRHFFSFIVSASPICSSRQNQLDAGTTDGARFTPLARFDTQTHLRGRVRSTHPDHRPRAGMAKI